jgi:hypothetical protein
MSLTQAGKPFNERFAPWHERVALPNALAVLEDASDLLDRFHLDE